MMRMAFPLRRSTIHLASWFGSGWRSAFDDSYLLFMITARLGVGKGENVWRLGVTKWVEYVTP